MRNRAGGILIENDKVLLIHRIKEIDGKTREYYVIPGGGIEVGETIDDTIKREVKEEIGIDVEIIDSEPRYTMEDDTGKQYYKFVKMVGGKIGTGTGPEFINPNGKYLPEMISIEDIINYKINMVPLEIKEQFISDFNNKKD